MKITVLLLLAMGALPAGGFCQDTNAPATPAAAAPPAPPPPVAPSRLIEDLWKARRESAARSQWNICVDLQMVAVEEAKAVDLIPDLQSEDQTKVDTAWTKLQGMIKAREAILLAWPMVRTIDHCRAVSESIAEQRYPTEFEPPFTPVPIVAQPASPPAPAEKPVPENAIPTGFETRNTGATLEVEPTVLDNGKRVHIEIVPQRVELLEMEKNETVMSNGRTVEVPQPLFATSKTTLSLTLMNGQRQLVGVHKLTKPANYIEFHLVRVTVTKSE